MDASAQTNGYGLFTVETEKEISPKWRFGGDNQMTWWDCEESRPEMVGGVANPRVYHSLGSCWSM